MLTELMTISHSPKTQLCHSYSWSSHPDILHYKHLQHCRKSTQKLNQNWNMQASVRVTIYEQELSAVPHWCKTELQNSIGHQSCTFSETQCFSKCQTSKASSCFCWISLSPSFSPSIAPSLCCFLSQLLPSLFPSSLGRIKGWGRGSLCRLCWDLWSTDLIFTLREKLAALMWGGAGPTGPLK